MIRYLLRCLPTLMVAGLTYALWAYLIHRTVQVLASSPLTR